MLGRKFISNPQLPRLCVYIAIVLTGLLNVIAYADLTPNASTRAFGDAASYYQMSQHTFAQVPNPFALRTLSPFIAHVLAQIPGVPLSGAWLLLTFIATTLSLIIFFKLIRDHLQVGLFASAITTLMLALTYNFTIFNYGDYWLVDPLNNLFWMLAILMVVKRQLVAFILVVIIGSVNKETTLLLAPLYPLLELGRAHRFNSSVIRGILAAVVSFALYLGYHIWAQIHVGGGLHYGMLSGSNGAGVLGNIVAALSYEKRTEYLRIFQTFQFLWIIFAFMLYRHYKRPDRRSTEFLIMSTYLVGAVFIGRLFATDVERVYVMAAPVIMAATAMAFDHFKDDGRRFFVGAIAFVYVALNIGWLTGTSIVWANVVALTFFNLLVLSDKIWPPLSASRGTDMLHP
jgi:hypothetical protein